jgi:hypothetical protein
MKISQDGYSMSQLASSRRQASTTLPVASVCMINAMLHNTGPKRLFVRKILLRRINKNGFL